VLVGHLPEQARGALEVTAVHRAAPIGHGPERTAAARRHGERNRERDKLGPVHDAPL
jgi:hypothetical protein